jgi:hypothetical protein
MISLTSAGPARTFGLAIVMIVPRIVPWGYA